MDISGNDDTNVETHKASDNPVNYPAPNMSSQWQISGSNLTNESMVMVSMPYLTMEASNCSSAPVIDSFCPQIYGGFCDVNVPNDATTSSSFGPVRTDMFWTPNAMLRGKNHAFLPSVPVTVPLSLPHLPTDSGFIERAARFSCFNGGNFGDMLNSFSNISGPLNPYSHRLGSIQGSKESLGVNGFNALPGIQSQMNEVNRTDGYKEATPPCKNDTEESPLKNEKHDEAKDIARTLPNEHDEAGFNGQEEMKGESSSKGPSGKKRKRTGQDMEREEHSEEPLRSIETADNNTTGSKQQRDQTPSSLLKNGGKNCKPGSQGSEPPKEGYIHIRARRGQATNSHSLAERVRREKISERMKFLQDLVPGCSKVTGKAVMLDEIINYVQSLQRQVEFLSMKLATVNPRLDFNIEALLANEILQPRPGLSPSSLAFPPNMHLPFSPLHHSQPGPVQAGVSSLCNSSPETLHRPSSVQPSPASGGFKEAMSKVPNVWEDELHNVFHMGFDSSAPLNSHDLSGSVPSGSMKAEP